MNRSGRRAARRGGLVGTDWVREDMVLGMPSSGEKGAPGLLRAIKRYGRPVERSYVHRVGKTFFPTSAGPKRLFEVVMLLRRRNGLYLVHTKEFYPKATYRLLSGGVKPGEDLIAAVRREALEETGLEVRIESFLGILRHQFVCEGRSLPLVSYLFAVVEESGVLGCDDPHEAITGFREVTLREIAAMADSLESLPPDWIDWGRFRATAHRLAGERL